MTVELACRLLESKVLLRSEVAAALQDATLRGVAFVQSLMERVPSALGILETEFSRWSGPIQTSLVVDEQLADGLPTGLCERLLALPLQRRDTLEAIPLAIVDPFDRHVLSEFEYCLAAAVAPVRVAYPVLVQALDAVRAVKGGAVEVLLDIPEDDETPAFGTRMLRVSRRQAAERRRRVTADLTSPLSRRGFTVPAVDAPERISEGAIPLVRTTLAPAARGTGSLTEASPEAALGRRDSEPVLRLVKQKPSLQMRRVSVPPPRFPDSGAVRPEDLLFAIDEARSPRHLIELLREAVQHMAPCHAYFSIRAGKYTLEWSTGCDPTDGALVTAEQQLVLDRACQVGYFLGPIPPDGADRALGAILGLRAREEIYVAPVQVAKRPALLAVVGRFDEAFALTRWVDTVVARAGQSLERLARHRK